MIEALIYKAASASFESVKLEIRLGRTIDDTGPSPRLLEKMTKALLKTEELF